MTRILEAFVMGVYYALIVTILTCAVVSTLVWTFRVYVLGHFPDKRPSWIKRPLKEVFNAASPKTSKEVS